MSINIPESVTLIQFYAFYNCICLPSIFIPSSVTLINAEAFFGCDSLVSIKVDDNNPNYDSRDNCNAIITKKQVEDVEPNTLVCGCVGTKIPNSVTKIGNEAFDSSCITSIDIPNGVVIIGAQSFQESSLTSIKFPTSVTNIEVRSFVYCESLVLVDLTDFDENSNIPELALDDYTGYYPFYGCSDDLKFKVTSEDMAQKFIDSNKNWPSELEKYDYPVL